MRSRRRSTALIAAVATVLVSVAVNLATARLARAYSPVVQRVVIGHSVEGRDIRAYRIGNPASTRKAVIIGQVHGDERAGTAVVRSLTHRRAAILGLDVWVIPTMNPDGYAAHTRQNAHHVDLNRNWPDNWAPLTGSYYSGRRPLSEPETRAVYRFLTKIKPRYVVSMHQPLDGIDPVTRKSTDPGFPRRLSRALHLPLAQDSPNKAGFACWDGCHGSMGDWAEHHMVGDFVTLEFPAHPSSQYLTNRAATGIITSMRGRFVRLSTHNPHGHVNSVTVSGRRVTVRGWTYDPDRTAAHVTVRIYDGVRAVGSARVRTTYADLPRASVNAAGVPGNHGFLTHFTATPGRHLYCVVDFDLAAGTGNKTSCHSVTIT